MTFLSSISRARGPFFEANVPVVVSLMIPLIVPINEVCNASSLARSVAIKAKEMHKNKRKLGCRHLDQEIKRKPVKHVV